MLLAKYSNNAPVSHLALLLVHIIKINKKLGDGKLFQFLKLVSFLVNIMFA